LERIEVTVFPDKKEYAENFLNKQQVPYQRIDGTTIEDKQIYRYIIVSPDNMSHSIIQTFSKIIDTKDPQLYIISEKIDATVSDYLNKMTETSKSEKKIPHVVEEIIPLTEPFVHFRKDMTIMIIISCAVALVGLFSNSPAVVIGAMLISPLLGPITAFAFNAAVGRPLKMVYSGWSVFVLISTVIAVSAILTFVTSLITDLPLTNEIEIRTKNSPVDIIIGVLLGIAGGIAMVSTIPGILVGVAIAAALVPPATVTGIGIAFLDYEIFAGGLLLTSSNIVGLMLGCMIVFYLKGITPRKYYERTVAKKYLMVSIIMFAFLGIMLGVFSSLD
jgi:uncharacterized hydrophobic protein (TIGR00341 family)